MAKLGYGDLIREHRVRRGFSVDALGRKINKSASTVTNYELERALPPIDVINDLVLALGFTPEELLEKMGVRMSNPPEASMRPSSR